MLSFREDPHTLELSSVNPARGASGSAAFALEPIWRDRE